MKSTRAKVVAITSRKGGAGKTASTSLLARYLCEKEGKQVLVVDFDGRGGITSLLCDHPVTRHTSTILEMLLDVHQRIHPRDTFNIALVETHLEENESWTKNNGAVYLIPSKPSLDDFLPGKNLNYLKTALDSLELPEDYLVLIDSGPDNINVHMTLAAADVVFVPLKFSPQDIHPTIETFRSICDHQEITGRPTLGGLIINQNLKTQWEQTYMENFKKLIIDYKEKTRLIFETDNLFIPMKQSRLILRGKHLEWSIQDELFEAARQMAAVINQAQVKNGQEVRYG